MEKWLPLHMHLLQCSWLLKDFYCGICRYILMYLDWLCSNDKSCILNSIGILYVCSYALLSGTGGKGYWKHTIQGRYANVKGSQCIIRFNRNIWKCRLVGRMKTQESIWTGFKYKFVKSPFHCFPCDPIGGLKGDLS